MNTSRVAVVAAVTSILAWTAKAVTIGLAGGHDGTAAEVLFLVGLVAQVAAVVALGLSWARGRSLGVRLAAVLAAPVAAMAVTTLVNGVVQRVQPADPSWVWAEVNLWVGAVLVLALATRVYLSMSPTTKNVDPRIATMSETSAPGSSSVST
jgi:MFS family permease